MACIAKKTKKRSILKLTPQECIQHLFVKFILYLRGEKMVSRNDVPFDDVEWLEDGSFKPSEKAIADVFQYLNGLWEKYVRASFKRGTHDKYINLFKQAVSEEWKASMVQDQTESQS